RDLVPVVVEVAIGVGAVVCTGWWNSPFFFTLATAIVIAGFARSFAFAINTATVTAVVVGVSSAIRSPFPDMRVAIVGASELLLIAFITGYARRMFKEAEARTSLALDRVARLNQANGLLQELHRVTQTLPASLDLGDVAAST